ncbi:MAG TPA: hypothetical protein VFY49_01060 [Myxococcota bacterium]|nr:hypothetical protein [Myxococcota bacterium]
MRTWILVLSLTLAAGFAVSCGFDPEVEIDSPVTGAFVSGNSVPMTGHTNLPGQPVIVKVNGVQVAVAPDGTFSANVAFVPDRIVQPVVVEMTYAGIMLDRDVATVFHGTGVVEGELAPDALGVRLTQPGFEAAAAGLAAVLPMDLGELVPPGTKMFDNYCILRGLFGVCLSAVDIIVAGSPAPSFGSLEVSIDPHQDYAVIRTTVNDLFVRADIRDSLTHLKLCSVNFEAGAAPIVANIALEPDPQDPSRIDAALEGVQVGFEDFSTRNVCALGALFDLLLPIVVGDVEDLAVTGFESFLRDPDGPNGPGDSVMADLVEDAFAAIDLPAAFSEALAADVDTSYFAVDEDDEGLTLDLDASLAPQVLDPDAVDLTASLLVPGPIPAFAPLTPGGEPYDIGLCLSSTLMNQVLKLQIEGGLLALDMTEANVFGGPTQLTTDLLGLFFPTLNRFPSGTPLTMRIRPQLPPIVDGRPGPAGELANLELGHLQVDIVVNGQVQLGLVLNLRMGIDLAMGDGALVTQVRPPSTANISVAIVENAIGESEQRIQNLMPGLMAFFFPSFAAEAQQTVELPKLLGLSLEPKEVKLVGTCIGVFGDFAAAP